MGILDKLFGSSGNSKEDKADDYLIIKKTSKVSSVFGIKSDLTLENLFNILSTIFYTKDVSEYIDEMIDEINNDGVSYFDDYFCVGVEENILYCGDVHASEMSVFVGIELLVKIFNEEFVRIQREQFGLDVKDYEGETFVYTLISDWNPVNNQNATDKVSYNDVKEKGGITYSQGEKYTDIRIFTRNESCYEINSLNTENIISPDKQKNIMECFYNGDKVLSNAKNMVLFIPKKHFDPKKWWLGWTGEDD